MKDSKMGGWYRDQWKDEQREEGDGCKGNGVGFSGVG